MKSLEEVKQEIEAKVPGVAVTVEENALVIPKAQWVDVAQFLKDSPSYELDFLSCLTGVDYPEHLEAVFHLFSTQKHDNRLTVKVRTDRAQANIPSVTSIWKSADFQEREAFDLLGITFTGHPNLKRILMWDSFEHFPLRKNYVPEDQDQLG